ncbi:DUF2927 domain-containing protein [Tropicimonas isoalkanivorans]|uniref:DUF2927 domain-containing protein n=1 Tax=Tropicimonas isoalkanivorans TaxID=441112 RepID=A0A1I1K023_9RHOB|nr:DUF2927 domain-containing protein [Tropicimonas isoalkanivorans]SFC51343.1 Protein of unknown function [Tropicimonas isoalkanivorans]
MAALAILSSCEATAPRGPVPIPPTRPEAPARAVDPQLPVRSQVSRDLERHYQRVQSDLKAQGLLRTDPGGDDTPFAAHNLAANFVRVALYDEYVSRAGQLVPEQTESQLRRWEIPVWLDIAFGETVPPDKRQTDTAALNAYAKRLAWATGHPIATTTGSNANFHVLVLHENERRGYGSRLRSLVPGIDEMTVGAIESMPRDTFCLVFALSRGDNPAYTQAIAVIRAEHPDLLRLSCLHEEVAQGLGLANDSPSARPSIFNDDEEFALLTRHDELLLRILYDPRLRPGMDAATARPIVETIARELMGGES